MQRRFAAILAADAVGYSKLMAENEESAFAELRRRRDLLDAAIAEYGGRIFGTAGDSVIAEFSSSVEAVRCGIQMQKQLKELNDGSLSDQRLSFRIGVNFGDVIVEGDNLLGDGVNIAARLEALAPVGGICISAQIADQIEGKLDNKFTSCGRHSLKNIAKPLDVLCWPPEAAKAVQNKARISAQRGLLLGATAGVVAVALLLAIFYVRGADDRDIPSGPRIAVIPFENISSDPEDVFFSEGLTRDINTQLSKFSNLFAIAPSSTREFQRNADCAKIRKDLLADYILEGTVRRSSNNIRVTTTFTDAKACRQLDSPGPFDRDLNIGSVLDIQSDIAKSVVAQIGSADAPLFNTSVQAEIRTNAPENLRAYECVLLSYWFYETFDSERHRKARSCLERAVKDTSGYSLGWSRLAFSYIESKKYSINPPEDWAERSQQAARQAISLDPSNPDAYYALAILSQMTGEDKTAFQNFAEKAVHLNPNDAFVLADLGTWMAYSGEWDKGKEWVSRAKLLNPKHQSWWDYIWHLHHYLKGEYKEARDVALKINLPENYMIQASLTAAYAMNGEIEEAQQTLQHLLELRPDYAKDPRAPFRTRGMPADLIESLMDGLRKAGLDVPPADR